MVLTLSEFGDGDTEEKLHCKSSFNEAFKKMQHIRREGKLCDIVLTTQNSRFSAHRIVLASQIPYFEGMLLSGMTEQNKIEIEISGVEPHTLQVLIDFAYTGELTVDINTVESILCGSNYFGMDAVNNFCCEFIKKHTNPFNVIGIRTLGKDLMCSELIENSDSYINKCFVDVAKSEEFFKLDQKNIEQILSRSNLNVTSEEEVFRATANWVIHDWKMRKLLMPELLKRVRLPLLKPQFLTDVVQNDQSCKDCLKCRDLIDSAKDFHLIPNRRSDFSPEQVTPRYCSQILGTIYAVGGLSSAHDALNVVEKFSPVSQRWEPVTGMVSCRSRVGVAALETKLYACGGYDGSIRLDTVEVYDSQCNKWSYVASMQERRSALGICTYDGKIFACGGYNGSNMLSSCEYYQPMTNEWKSLPNMNKARSAVAVTVFENHVWVLGGHDGLTIFNSVEKYDHESNRWCMETSMLSKRCRHGAASMKGKLYVFGGYDGREFLTSCEMYDRNTQQFTRISSMQMRRSRVGVTISGTKIYCLGGYDGSKNLKSVECYDVEKEEWSAGEEMLLHDGGVGVCTMLPQL